jgi:predicted amidohydrolase YtcJ
MLEDSQEAVLREKLFGLSADFVLFNGNVITINPEQPRAEAVAVKKGRIVGVGSNSEINQCCNPKTENIDLKGKTLLPGFIASHNHLSAYASSKSAIDCSSEVNKSIDSILAKVKEKAESIPEGTWIEGHGYNHMLLTEKRHVNRWDLDKVAPDHPVHLLHFSGHFSAVNSHALKMAGISRDTPEPVGGEIFRDESGEPTGVLAEKPAQCLVQDLLPPKSVEDLIEGLKLVNHEYVKAGVTSTHDAAIGGILNGLTALQAYEKAYSNGALSVRVYAMPFISWVENILDKGENVNSLGICTGCGDEWFKVGPIKIIQDGSIQGLTAALSEPYYCDPSRTGYLNHPQEKLNELVLKYHKAGFQVAIHGNGDHGIESVVQAYESALSAHPRGNHRHRIEHCQMVTEEQLQRMARSGIAASFFSPHVYYWGDGHRDSFIGPQRAARIDPLKSALDKGIIFGLHDDCPIVPISPLMCIHTAVHRETKSGQMLGQEQAISVEEALKAMTINGAYLAFEENIKGSIEISKLADFVAISADPFQINPAEIKNLQVELTIIDGKVVYQP